MAYTLNLIITSPLPPELNQAVLDEAASHPPSIRLPRPNLPPSANHPPQHFLSNHAHFAVDDRDDDRRSHPPTAESLAAVLSEKFPTLTVAYIALECFGGHCEHAGTAWLAGQLLHREVFDEDPSSHCRLLAHVGITLPDDHFLPFRRGYFEDTPIPPPR